MNSADPAVANGSMEAADMSETTATGSLLKQIGIELSEPMLFGIGEGLGFIFWNT